MKTLRLLAAASVAAFALLGSAKAAIINIAEVIDLDVWAANGYYSNGTSHYTISDGDTVNISYTFANGKALKLTNPYGGTAGYTPAWPWLEATNTVGGFSISNASVNLTNPSFTGGSGDTSVSEASHQSSSIHLGLYGTLYLDALASVEFTGVSSSFTVDYVPEGTGDYVSWFSNYGLSFEPQIVNSSSNVPDSGTTLALFGLGLASLALIRRKR